MLTGANLVCVSDKNKPPSRASPSRSQAAHFGQTETAKSTRGRSKVTLKLSNRMTDLTRSDR